MNYYYKRKTNRGSISCWLLPLWFIIIKKNPNGSVYGTEKIYLYNSHEVIAAYISFVAFKYLPLDFPPELDPSALKRHKEDKNNYKNEAKTVTISKTRTFLISLIKFIKVKDGNLLSEEKVG